MKQSLVCVRRCDFEDFATTLAILSSIILAAHFLRSGSLLIVIVCLLLPALLLIRRTWAVRLLQAALILAAAEWVRTTVELVQDRQALGQSWERLAAILVGVALLSVVSALVQKTRLPRPCDRAGVKREQLAHTARLDPHYGDRCSYGGRALSRCHRRFSKCIG